MSAVPPIRLGINIDHVATLRNARGGRHPDPLRAAAIAIEAGADNITAHLREDRRHITDDDIARLAANLTVPLNMEMAATPEMLAIALKTKPHASCIVPEKRTERTTEDGLEVAGQHNQLAPFVDRLGDAGIRVSLFIAPELRQIEAAAHLRAPAIEIHVGPWCEAIAEAREREAEAEWRRIVEGARAAHGLGLEVHAGHGLDYATAATISALPEVVELNIGHFLVGEAVFVGLGETVRRMRQAMDRGRASLRQSATATMGGDA
jgi:pyridoxine 5-phosphate synthase